MSLKPSIWQIVNPFFLQDWQDANPSAVSYPLNVADWVKGWSSAVDPLSLDIAGLPTGTLATTTELAINNGTVNEKTTLSDLATFLDGRDVYSVADITALNAITGMDTGDVAIVADTFDDTWENIAGSYIYNGTTWLLQSWYNVYLNTLLDVNAPSPATGDILQWDGTQWVNVANAFAPLNWTPTEVRYFDNAWVDHSDPLFTRDSVTNHTEATRDYNSTSSTINTATVPVQFLTQNTNGTFNIGDQVETRFWEAQAEVLDVGTVSTYFVVYLTNITGTLPIGVDTRLNNLTTPFQTDDWNILKAQFTIWDTVNVIDLSAWFTIVWNINITQASGQDFNYTVNSGTIAIGNYLYWPSLNKVGFIYNLTSNIVNKTINTGFRTEPIQFPNVPFIIEWSAIVATDGVDKMAVGVFDLSASGQSELSAGIVAHYATGESVVLTLQNNDLFIEVYDGASDSYLQSASPTTFTLKNTISGIEHGISQSSGAVTLGNLSGGNNTKITINDVTQLITLWDGVNGTFIKINDANQRIELNTSTWEYRVLTSPPSAITQTEALVRDTVTGILYVKDLSSLYTSSISTKTSNYSVVVADQWNIIHIDNSATAIDITLPDPTTVSVGKVFRFKAVWNSANTVRFLPFASENIDLSAWAYTWANPAWLQALEVYTDWVEWFIS